MSKEILLSSTSDGGIDTLKHTGIKKTSSGFILVTNTSPTPYDSFLLCNDNYILSFHLVNSKSSGYLVKGDGFTPKDELGNEVTALHITRSSSYLYVSTTEGYIRFYDPLTGNPTQVEGQYYLNIAGETEFLSYFQHSNSSERTILAGIKDQNKIIGFLISTPISSYKELYLMGDPSDVKEFPHGNMFTPDPQTWGGILCDRKVSFSGMKGLFEPSDTYQSALISDSNGVGYRITDTLYDANIGIINYSSCPKIFNLSQITEVTFPFISVDYKNSFLLTDRKLNVVNDFGNIHASVFTNPYGGGRGVWRSKDVRGPSQPKSCAVAKTVRDSAFTLLQGESFTLLQSSVRELYRCEGEVPSNPFYSCKGYAYQGRIDLQLDFNMGNAYDDTYVIGKKRSVKTRVDSSIVYGSGLNIDFTLLNVTTGNTLHKINDTLRGTQFAGDYDYNFLIRLQDETTPPIYVSNCEIISGGIVIGSRISLEQLWNYANQPRLFVADFAIVSRPSTNGTQIILDDDYLDFALNPS